MTHPLRYLIGVAMFGMTLWLLWQVIYERNPRRLLGLVLMMVGTSIAAIHLTSAARGSTFFLLGISFFGVGLLLQGTRDKGKTADGRKGD